MTTRRFLLPFLLAVAPAYSASLSVGVYRVTPGTTIAVPVTISAEQPFSGYQFTLVYNKDVIGVVRVEKGDVGSSFNLMANTTVAGVVRVGAFDPSLAGVSGAGTIATVTIEAKKSGQSQLSLSNARLSSPDGKSIACSAASGSVTVEGTDAGSDGGTADGGAPPGGGAGGTDAGGSASGVVTTSYTRTVIGPDGKPVQTVETTTLPFASRGTQMSVTVAPPVLPKRPEEMPQEKPVLPETPSNSCVLLVISPYGSPVPPRGIATFGKGERVECTVESTVILNENEKMVCTGYEGTGAVRPGVGNHASVEMDQNGKIVWKWEKRPIEKGFTLDVRPTVEFRRDALEVSIPVKAVFEGGFPGPVAFSAVSVPSGFEASVAGPLTPEKPEAALILKKRGAFPAGRHRLTVAAVSGTVKKEAAVSILVPARARLTVSSGAKGEPRGVLLFDAPVAGVSTFQLSVRETAGLRWKDAAAPVKPPSRFFTGVEAKDGMVSVSGSFMPSFAGLEMLAVPFAGKPPSGGTVSASLRGAAFWDENGDPLPLEAVTEAFPPAWGSPKK